MDDVARIKKQHELRKNKLGLNKKATNALHDIEGNPLKEIIKSKSSKPTDDFGNNRSPTKLSFIKNSMETAQKPEINIERKKNEVIICENDKEKIAQKNLPETATHNANELKKNITNSVLKKIRSKSPRFSEALVGENSSQGLKNSYIKF